MRQRQDRLRDSGARDTEVSATVASGAQRFARARPGKSAGSFGSIRVEKIERDVHFHRQRSVSASIFAMMYAYRPLGKCDGLEHSGRCARKRPFRLHPRVQPGGPYRSGYCTGKSRFRARQRT